jgi:hypothetical protein
MLCPQWYFCYEWKIYCFCSHVYIGTNNAMPCHRTQFSLMIHLVSKSEHTKESLFLLIFIYLTMLIWLNVWICVLNASFNFVTKFLIASIVALFFNFFQYSSIASLTILSTIILNVTMYFWRFDKIKNLQCIFIEQNMFHVWQEHS